MTTDPLNFDRPAMSAEADNALKIAETRGTCVYVRQAPEFAEDHSEDTVIIVLRGEKAVRLGREALVAQADLVQETLTYAELASKLAAPAE